MIHTETVHPSQLRRAMASYAAQGYPPAYGPHPALAGMMVIVITVPDDSPIPDWQYAPPPPRRRFRFDLRRLAMLACALVIAASLAYIAYGMFAGTTAPAAPAAPTPEPSLWDRIASVVPHGEPVVEHVKPKAIEMPWDAAGRQVGEAVEGIGRVLTAMVVLLLLGVVAWVVAKARGVVGR